MPATPAWGTAAACPRTIRALAAYGTVDELNALLGLLLAQIQADVAIAELIRGVQNDLFDVGADLCLPIRDDDKALRVRGTKRTAGENDRSLQCAFAAAQELHPSRRHRSGGVVPSGPLFVGGPSETW